MRLTQSSASRPVRNLGYIDAVRGLGVLCVLLDHCSIQAGVNVHWTFVNGVGNFGVQLFYVASAFTLFLSLDGRKAEASPIRNFFLRRFFRIAPMFYLAMLLTLLLNPLRIALIPEPSNWDRLLGFFFLHGFSPTGINSVTAGSWSVADECMFYAILPWLYLRVRTLRGSVVALVLGMAVNHLVNFFYHRSFPSQDQYIFWWFPTELPIFIIGIIGYYLWKTVLHSGSLRPRFARLLSLALLGIAAGIFGFMHHHLPFLYGVAALAVLLGLMLHPWIVPVNRAMRFLGKISYSMYLLHSFVIVLLSVTLSKLTATGHPFWHDRLYGTPTGFLMYLAALLCLSVPLCTVSWLYVEEPSIALGRRLIARLDHTPKPPAPLLPDTQELLSKSSTGDNQF
jgi:peptidoglycan/LPS O-acetylase OafA/YrhL